MDRASIDRILTAEETRALDRLIEDSSILLEPARDSSGGGVDGARWTIEVADNEHYHLIDRWSPKGGDPVHQLGLAMLRLTGWELEALY